MTTPSRIHKQSLLTKGSNLLWLALLPSLACSTVFAETTAEPEETTEEVVQLDEYTIIAFEREYTQQATETGLGFDADPMTVPITTVSIPMDILDDQQVNNVEDALRNVAGVTRFKQGNGGEEKFSIRGFDASQSIYKDGARINNSLNATNIATTETANIERFDVLKGPAAILYGQGEPGGIINYVTKKPEFEQFGSLEGIAGTDNYYRVEADVTGPIGGPDSNWAYRFITSYEDSEADRDYVERERLLIAPSITWEISEKTNVTLQYEYIDDEYTQDRGQILDGRDSTGYEYSSRLDNSQFYGIPGWNEGTESEYQRFGILLNHEFQEGAEFSLNASTTSVEKTLQDSNPLGLSFLNPALDFVIVPNGFGPLPTPVGVLNDGDMLISSRGTIGDGYSDSITAKQTYKWEQSEDIMHQFLLLGDYERLESDYDNMNTGPAPFGSTFVIYNVDTETYSGIPADGIDFTGVQSPRKTEVEQYGISLQDLISFNNKWHLLIGGRYTEYEDKESGESDYEFTPRAGLIYQFNDSLSVYGSWAKGFVPTTFIDINNDLLDPETSEQFEIGLKWSTLENRLHLNAALFDLRKKDIVAQRPGSFNPDDLVNFGETRTQGFDLQVVGNVTDKFRLIAGYAYLENELTDVGEDAADQKGNSLPGIPEHSFNFWGVYEFQNGTLRGLGLGGGVFAQTDSYVSTENRAEYDSWIQLDAVAYYKRDNWKLQLNVKNITDEEYNLAQAGTTTDNFGAIRVGTSAPTSATVSLSYAF